MVLDFEIYLPTGQISFIPLSIFYLLVRPTSIKKLMKLQIWTVFTKQAVNTLAMFRLNFRDTLYVLPNGAAELIKKKKQPHLTNCMEEINFRWTPQWEVFPERISNYLETSPPHHIIHNEPSWTALCSFFFLERHFNFRVIAFSIQSCWLKN